MEVQGKINKEIIIHPTNDKRAWYRDVYLKSGHWIELRARKLARPSSNCCNACKKPGLLEVHHVNYRKIFDVGLKDLIVLCKSCHHLVHELIDKRLIVFSEYDNDYRLEQTLQVITFHLHISKIITLDSKKYRKAKKSVKKMIMRGRYSKYHREKQPHYI